MYKIMIRESEARKSWTDYKEDNTIFKTDDIEVLVRKVRELFDHYSRTQVRVIQDMSYTLDILFD